jgi:hypothetical protein
MAGFGILNIGGENKKRLSQCWAFSIARRSEGSGAQTQPTPKYLKTQSNGNFHFRFKWISVNRTCRQLDKNAA